jgi:hypothetical protein
VQELVPGAEVVSMTTDHAPRLLAPRLLADLLIPFLAAAQDGKALAPFNLERAGGRAASGDRG